MIHAFPLDDAQEVFHLFFSGQTGEVLFEL